MTGSATAVGDTIRAWRVTRHGRPSEALELQRIATPRPGPNEMLIHTAATVCNYNEVDGCHGRYRTIDPPLPYTLGMELVGEVVEAGEGAESWLGRRVMATATGATGAHAEAAVAPVEMTFDVPPELDDTAAAAFFYPFHLAYLGLHERARLEKGETVLVHAAAGGVGSAAVQLAVAAGARVIATAGSDEKLDVARSFGADVAINYRESNFVDAVLDATNGRGVDVCFDGVGGDVMLQSFKCLARNGRHVVVGFAGGIEAEDIPLVTGRMLCFGNISVMGVILSYRDPASVPRGTGYNPVPREVGEALHEHLTGMLRAGQIRPFVGKTVGFEQLPAALDEMEDRATVGRTVVRWR
ncbi:MAG TPA: NADPH:quinone oxidoreductase family protein [Acidimicrobiales bacterium]